MNYSILYYSTNRKIAKCDIADYSFKKGSEDYLKIKEKKSMIKILQNRLHLRISNLFRNTYFPFLY